MEEEAAVFFERREVSFATSINLRSVNHARRRDRR
jgi:hypothetical protein